MQQTKGIRMRSVIRTLSLEIHGRRPDRSELDISNDDLCRWPSRFAGIDEFFLLLFERGLEVGAHVAASGRNNV
jgi:hypothetical protein